MKLKQKTKESIAKVVVAVFVAFIPAVKLDQWLTTPSVYIHASETGETSGSAPVEVSPSPSPTDKPEIELLEEIAEENDQYEEMKAIVVEVFGSHSEKALRLLSCENRSLNPRAINDNRTWGGVGVDRGIFQINDYWQGVRHEGKAIQFLFDPEINVRIAWRIYEDSGYSFHMWTCGKNLGI